MRTRVLLTVFPVKTRLRKDKLFIWCFFVDLFLVACLGSCVDVDTLVEHQLTFSLTFRSSVLVFPHCGTSILGNTSHMSCLCVVRTDLCTILSLWNHNWSKNKQLQCGACSWMQMNVKVLLNISPKIESNLAEMREVLVWTVFHMEVMFVCFSDLHSSCLFHFSLQNQTASHCSDRWICKDV